MRPSSLGESAISDILLRGEPRGFPDEAWTDPLAVRAFEFGWAPIETRWPIPFQLFLFVAVLTFACTGAYLQTLPVPIWVIIALDLLFVVCLLAICVVELMDADYFRRRAVRSARIAYILLRWPMGEVLRRRERIISALAELERCLWRLPTMYARASWSGVGAMETSQQHFRRAAVYIQRLRQDLLLAGPETEGFVLSEVGFTLAMLLDGSYGELRLAPEGCFPKKLWSDLRSRLIRFVLSSASFVALLVAQ